MNKAITLKMKNEIYFLPIDYRNISIFFSEGLIKPISLFSKKRQRLGDIQTDFKSRLLLTKEQWVKSCSASVEVLLTEEENAFLHEIDGADTYFTFSNVIPISRIKKIHLLSERSKSDLISNINQGSGYLPARIVHVVSNPIYSDFKGNINYSQNNDDEEILIKNNEKFDRLIGGMSLMRGISFYNKDYSDFLNFIHNINIFLSNQATNISKSLGNNAISEEAYSSLFSSENNEWASIRALFNKKNIDKDFVANIAKEKKQKIQYNETRKKVIINLADIAKRDEELYLICLLSQYGDDTKPFKVERFLKGVLNGELPYPEAASLIYGLYNGYSVLYNEYQLPEISDKLITKFKLETQLDYYLIESAYQKVILGKVKEEIGQFSYLEECLPPMEPIPESEEHDYIMLFDEVVMVKKKTVFLSKDYLEKLRNSYSESLKAVCIEALDSGFDKPFKKWFMNIAEQLRQDSDKHKQSYESKLEKRHAEKEAKLMGRISELEEKNSALEKEMDGYEIQISKLEESLERTQTTTEKEHKFSEDNHEISFESKQGDEKPPSEDKIAVELGEEKGVAQEEPINEVVDVKEPTEESKADDKVSAMSVEKEDTVDGVKENKKEERAIDQEDKTPVLDDHKQSFEKEQLSIEKNITNDKTDDEVEDLKNPEHKVSKPSVPKKKKSTTAKKTKAENENTSGDIFKKE